MKTTALRQNRILAGAVLLMIAFGLTTYSTGYFVVNVTEEMGIARSLFTLYIMILNLVSVAVTPMAGRMLRRAPLRKILIVNAVAGGLFLSGFSLARGVMVFYVFAGLMGVVRDICTMLMVPYVISRTFGDKSGLPMGISMSGTAVCGIILGLILPRFLLAFGWRRGYIFIGILWALLLLFTAIVLFYDIDREMYTGPAAQASSAASMRNKAEQVGAANAAAVKDAAAQEAPGNHAEEKNTAVQDAAGNHAEEKNSAVKTEETAAAAPVPSPVKGTTLKEATRSSYFYFFLLAVFVVNAVGAFFQQLSAHYVAQGASLSMAGLIMSFFSVATIALKIWQGFLYDKIGAAKCMVITNVIFAVAFFLSIMTSIPMLYLSAVLIAYGMASLTIMPSLLTRTVFGMREYAEIYSFSSMAFTLGNAVGNPLWGLIYDRFGSYVPGLAACPFILAGVTVIFLLSIRAGTAKMAAANELIPAQS